MRLPGDHESTTRLLIITAHTPLIHRIRILSHPLPIPHKRSSNSLSHNLHNQIRFPHEEMTVQTLQLTPKHSNLRLLIHPLLLLAPPPHILQGHRLPRLETGTIHHSPREQIPIGPIDPRSPFCQPRVRAEEVCPGLIERT